MSMNIVVIGPPGSGKSVQAHLLAEHLGLPYISMGDIFRKIAEERPDLNHQVEESMRKGELVSDKKPLNIIEETLAQSQYQQGFVLEGFPRKLDQAQEFPKKIDQVFYLKISDKIGIERLIKRGRPDDKPNIIKERLSDYHQQTEPILGFYREKGILVEINGEQSIEKVHQDIARYVKM